MRALTLHQPWATLVAIGVKTIETRPFAWDYRGALAIHAAKTFDDVNVAICRREPFRSVLVAAGYSDALQLPTGCIISLHNLEDAFRFPFDVRSLDQLQGILTDRGISAALPAHEIEFGNYAGGRRGLYLTNRRRLGNPVAVRGLQGLWPVSEDVAERVRHEVRA